VPRENVKAFYKKMVNDEVFCARIQAAKSKMVKPLLPRSPWTNQISYLRILFRTKQALDRIEQKIDLD
jgi:hypothetical protein